MSEPVLSACPACGQYTLFRPEEWTSGGPLKCANPTCVTNFPDQQFCPAAVNYQGAHIPCTEGERGHGVTKNGWPAHSNAEHEMIWVGDEPERRPDLDDEVAEPKVIDQELDQQQAPPTPGDPARGGMLEASNEAGVFQDDDE